MKPYIDNDPRLNPMAPQDDGSAATPPNPAKYWQDMYTDLLQRMAKSCDDGRFEDVDWACPRAVKAESTLAAQSFNTATLLRELYEWCRGCNDFRVDSNLARRVQSALALPDHRAEWPYK